MHKWSPLFYLRFLLYLMLGFGLYYYLQPEIRYLYILYAVAWGLYLLLLYAYRRFHYPGHNLLLGIMGGLVLVLSGGLRVGQLEQRLQEAHEARLDSVEAFQVRLQEDFRLKGKYWRGAARVEAYRRGGRWRPLRAKLLLYLPSQDSLLPKNKLLFGERWILRGSAQKISIPRNPRTFNFQAFYKNQGIVYQHFAKQGQYFTLEQEGHIGLFAYAYAIRRALEGILKTYISQKDNLAILSALLLGVKSGLNPDIKSVFADSGLMHILAVSGLHIGFLVWLLHVIFRGLLGLPYGKGLYTIIIICILWAYVLLTGSSPSVLRAVSLFSFILVGRVWNKRPSYYNLLAASAFYLLLYDPFLLFSVGFQLSYAAVLAIMYIQPRLYRVWEPKNWAVNYLWALATVSIAAQIGTFPLSIYYFHQFPSYFLLANVLILPLVPFVLYGAWALVFVFWIPPLAKLGAILLEYALLGILGLARMIQNLPGATWDTIYWHQGQVLVIYLIIVLFLLLLSRPQRVYQGLLILLGTIWLSWSLNKAYTQYHQTGMGVFSLYGKGVLYMYKGHKAIILYDSAHSPQEKDWEYTIRPSLHPSGLHTIKPHILGDSLNIPCQFTGQVAWIVWNSKLLVWTVNPLTRTDFVKLNSLSPDYWIVSQGAIRGLSGSIDVEVKESIVLDASVPSWMAKQFIEAHPRWKNKVYAVSTEGAWEKSF